MRTITDLGLHYSYLLPPNPKKIAVAKKKQQLHSRYFTVDKLTKLIKLHAYRKQQGSN